MRLRVASIAFLLATTCVGLAWLTLQPVVFRFLEMVRRLAPSGSPEYAALHQVRALLPAYLAADLIAATLLAWVVLWIFVLRPLGRAEATIEQLGRLRLHPELPFERTTSSPLLERLQDALQRFADALRQEQATTRRQLAELTAANEQLQRAQTGLIASERLATVGRLAAGVAHEVGNPLAGILGYLSLARDRSADPQLTDFLVRSEAEVQRIDAIVRRLLDVGRTPKGAVEPMALAPAVQSCLALLHKSAELAQVELENRVDPDVVVRAEAGPLSQILINLVLNAGQAMEGKGRITLSTERRDPAVLLHVDDTGPGLSPQARAHLFEPFFTTKAAGKGTGLGLAISQSLATSIGGRLEAADAPGGGARFTLELRGA